MDLQAIQKRMENCPCGVKHECDLKGLEVGHGNLFKTGEILKKYNFPTHILMVADKNSFLVTSGLAESLLKEGFLVQMRVYDDTKVALNETAMEIKKMCEGVDGVLSVGTGSVNDICRYGAYLAGKPLAIFATAPSMDGFASDSAPIIIDGFKISCQCRQPVVIIADTVILAAAPAEPAEKRVPGGEKAALQLRGEIRSPIHPGKALRQKGDGPLADELAVLHAAHAVGHDGEQALAPDHGHVHRVDEGERVLLAFPRADALQICRPVAQQAGRRRGGGFLRLFSAPEQSHHTPSFPRMPFSQEKCSPHSGTNASFVSPNSITSYACSGVGMSTTSPLR